MPLCHRGRVVAWIENPEAGGTVVTGDELAISLLSPAGFVERCDLEERNPDDWRYHPQRPRAR